MPMKMHDCKLMKEYYSLVISLSMGLLDEESAVSFELVHAAYSWKALLKAMVVGSDFCDALRR